MLYVEQFVYSNRLRSSHPLERLALVSITMSICLAAQKPGVHLAVLALMLGLLVVKARIPGYVVAKLMLVPLAFLLVGVVSIALSAGRDYTGMVFAFKITDYYLGVTAPGLNLAGMTMLRSLSCVSCLYFLALTTPLTELIYVLRLLRLPGVIIELMVLVYRFAFLFIECAFRIYTAQSSRWGYCSYKRSIYSLGTLFANIWAKAFIRARRLFTSLLSRGYEEELNFINPVYNLSLLNISFIVFVSTCLVIMAWF